MAFDAQTAWVRLGAFIASKPSHGRQDLLAAMARIADENTMDDEDFQRALRLTLPTLAEAIFDRDAQQAPVAAGTPDPVQTDPPSHARGERPTMAAA